MSTLYIAEFGAMGAASQGGPAEVVQMPPLAEQTIAIGGSTTKATNPFGTNTRYIRVETDAICSIAVGDTNVVATNIKMRMAADQAEYFGVSAGQYIAVITNS